MSDPILVGLAERVRALEITLEVNLRALEGRLVALETATRAAERADRDLRALDALGPDGGRAGDPA